MDGLGPFDHAHEVIEATAVLLGVASHIIIGVNDKKYKSGLE
jgi:hypothetical protein